MIYTTDIAGSAMLEPPGAPWLASRGVLCALMVDRRWFRPTSFVFRLVRRADNVDLLDKLPGNVE